MKKKLLALLLAGCMVLSVTACGSKEEKEQPETATEETTVDTSALGTSKIKELGEYKGISYRMMDTVVTDAEVEAEVHDRGDQPMRQHRGGGQRCTLGQRHGIGGERHRVDRHGDHRDR